MTAATTTRVQRRRRSPAKSFATFFRTPKGLAMMGLLLLVAIAEPREGAGAMGVFVASTVTAVGVDLVMGWVAHEKWTFPDGGLLTGMIVGMIMSPNQAWLLGPLTAFVAILSKYALRTRWSNVFNPAAFALVVSAVLFHSEQSWWGSLPDLSPLWFVALAAIGLYIASKVNKLPMVLTFLGTTLLVFTVAAYRGDATQVAEIFRAPDIQMILFFAAIMLTDPPTSPAHPRHQYAYAVVVAAASCAAFLGLYALWFLPGGLLVGNLWESCRRLAARRWPRSA
ncbi:MAG TPA: RnfABCDGE type electron transport complex subunit D [Bacillota bacterium]|nr:RnfABCDGE type electron transport complex subunit D [Bacillota bacterium]